MLDIPSAANLETKSAELLDKQLFRLFPTPMFTGKLSDLALCDRVEKALRDLQRSGQGAAAPSSARMRAYMTADDLQTLPQMQELVDVIMKESEQVLDIYAIKRTAHYITNMWANIAHPNRRHSMHMHPNCLLSGLVYIKTPKHCGPTVFASPRQLAKNLEPAYLQKNEFNADVFVMPPEKGRMLMWPSHVPHAVEEGNADESQDRIVVAFNIMIRGKSEMSTAAINFV
ncbi:MAG: TIGR02466 family protein [Xanthobacteraceae bacterium]